MVLIMYIFFNFAVYSFIGWIIEELYFFTTTKSFKKEGFLIGPFKPMYGIAMTILVLLSKVYGISGIMLVLLCFSIPTIVEYISGYILKNIFGEVYWNYSNSKFNINGYICLRFSIYWTLLSFIGVNYFQVIVDDFFYNMDIRLLIFFIVLEMIMFWNDLGYKIYDKVKRAKIV